MNTENQTKIKNLISELTGLELSQLSNAADFEADLNLNQLEVNELIASLAEKLSIELDHEEVAKIKTVGRLINVVSEKLEE